MGYKRPSGWGIASEGLTIPLQLQGQRLVAKTPPTKHPETPGDLSVCETALEAMLLLG